eukprot:GHVL01036634.1.p1 GENE.GHVL01036634.1~~GHVL01036634.1.p1  ORF type:complete len:273 (+),score=55.04 GHVL01036634.1:95-913(+)
MSLNANQQFFRKNLEVTGFGKKNGFFQCCKELVDNAVDACNRKTGSNIVRISIEETKPLRTTIRVQDTGVGIETSNIMNLGTLFGSTKSKDIQSGGRFGIGLKSVVMHSHASGGAGVSAKLRVSSSDIWLFELLYNEENGIHVANVSVQKDASSWMTEFSVELPTPPTDGGALLTYLTQVSFWCENLQIQLSAIEDQIIQNSNFSPQITRLLVEHGTDLCYESSILEKDTIRCKCYVGLICKKDETKKKMKLMKKTRIMINWGKIAWKVLIN